ncbi:hypothetical protein NVIE_1129 [Nitrososphaera viennensis EN76]|uniref:Uncharacterized protein n=1 Tax=Nitrososphaera viennensis EN76 TaxID=926571 RepID=A0A060HJ74_9ARCH|nr:hypothetical protein NVIE_1129 [Nitrososphaera viennensis EN76]
MSNKKLRVAIIIACALISSSLILMVLV